jgi:hypothetical protein
MPPPKLTLFGVLEREERPITVLVLASCKNTDPTPDGVDIPLELIGSWGTCTRDPFPDYDSLVAYAEEDGVYQFLCEERLSDEEKMILHPGRRDALNDEKVLESNLKIHFDIVNHVLEKCIDATTNQIATIHGGKSAQAGDEAAGINSEPNKASLLIPTPAPSQRFDKRTDGPRSQSEPTLDTGTLTFFDLKDLGSEDSKKFENVIPGELKMSFKFRYELINSMKKKTIHGKEILEPDYTKRGEARKVFTQIYQYMNERNTAIGYILTDQELICVRRPNVERHGCTYGVIDISPPIPLSCAPGRLGVFRIGDKTGQERSL